MDLINFFGSNKGERNTSHHGLVTGFLIEFEDTLPFKGNLECIRSDSSHEKCYTIDQVKKLVSLITKDLKM